VVNTCGKKAVTLEAVLNNLIGYLSGKDPPMETYFNIAPKDETFAAGLNALEDEYKNAKFQDKLRMFVIPNTFYILLERLCCGVRCIIERGGIIMIGFKWSRGGADRLAKMFGVTRKNWRKKVFGDGDVTNLDLNIHQVFLRIFYESGLVYYKKGTKEYEQLKELITYLVERVTQRISHLFGKLWAIITGGMPSGCLMTSHGDSFIMALWFYMFCVHQMDGCSPELAEKIERELMTMIILIIVYGDDHVICTSRDPDIMNKINIFQFRDWLAKYLSVQLRDCRHDIPYVTVATKGPFAQRTGMIFLRHHVVLNDRYSEPGQPEFIPYRESREPIQKAVWGRTPRDRDEVDVALSCIGHAYGTYASNAWTYEWLKALHQSCIKLSGMKAHDCLSKAISRIGKDDLAKTKQLGISADELRSGFPSWKTLVERNIWDATYHEKPSSLPEYAETSEVYECVF